MSKKVKVEIIDSNNKPVAEYLIKRLNVSSNTRRLEMNAEIIDLDISDTKKGQLLTCSALAATLHDKKGDLVYDGEDGAQKLFDDMDIEEYDILCKAYLDINPLETTLEAKKKKS